MTLYILSFWILFRDMNHPKFVFEDVPLFLGLIKDLFPGLECPRVGYPDFNAAVTAVLERGGYIVMPHQASYMNLSQRANPCKVNCVVGLFSFPSREKS